MLLLLAAALAAAALTSTTGSATAAAPRTTIRLKVVGCDGCTVLAVQTRGGDAPYMSTNKVVRNGMANLSVPTARTRGMSVLVYSSFSEEQSYPTVAVTQFRAKKPGATVSWAYARQKRTMSGCWAGTSRNVVRNTMVVKHVTVAGKDRAAAFLKRTWRSGPVWITTRKAAYYVSEASMCP